MKNIFDVLRQKESDLQQLQKEIEALRLASRILVEEGAEEAPKPIRGAVPASSGNGSEAEAASNTPFRQFP